MQPCGHVTVWPRDCVTVWPWSEKSTPSPTLKKAVGSHRKPATMWFSNFLPLVTFSGSALTDIHWGPEPSLCPQPVLQSRPHRPEAAGWEVRQVKRPLKESRGTDKTDLGQPTGGPCAEHKVASAPGHPADPRAVVWPFHLKDGSSLYRDRYSRGEWKWVRGMGSIQYSLCVYSVMAPFTNVYLIMCFIK